MFFFFLFFLFFLQSRGPESIWFAGKLFDLGPQLNTMPSFDFLTQDLLDQPMLLYYG